MNRKAFCGITILVLFLGGSFLGFVTLENHELDKWTDPAKTGQFVVAIRVDRGNWQKIDDTARQVDPLLPSPEAGDGNSGHYQKWRGSGWRRICSHNVAKLSLQELADKSGETIKRYGTSHVTDGNCRVCVIDSTGNVYLPRD